MNSALVLMPLMSLLGSKCYIDKSTINERLRKRQEIADGVSEFRAVKLQR